MLLIDWLVWWCAIGFTTFWIAWATQQSDSDDFNAMCWIALFIAMAMGPLWGIFSAVVAWEERHEIAGSD